MAKFSGSVAAIFLQSGSSVAMTDESTTTTDRYTYRIQNRSKRYIDRNAAVTVKVNGNVVSSGFTINYFLGAVTFSTQREVNDTVTISGRYLPVAEVGQGFEWTLELEDSVLDVTDFSSGAWRTKVQNLNEATASFSWWWGDESLFTALNNGQPVILSLFTDDTSSMSRYDCLAIPKSTSVEVAPDEIVKEKIEFKILDMTFISGGL